MTFIQRSLAFILILSSAAVFAAESAPAPSVRAGAIYVPDHTPDKSSSLGFELGYASPVFPFENMTFTWGHVSRSELEHNTFLLNFEDSYPLAEKLYLYGSSGIGVVLLDQKPGPDKNSAMGRLALGTRVHLCSRIALFAEANFLIALDNVWFNGDELKNRTWQYVAGLQYKF